MKKLLFLLVGFSLASVLWYQWAVRPVDSDSEIRSYVKIASGLSVQSIGDLLFQKGLIRSTFAFRLYNKLNGTQASLKAGDYFLEPSMDVREIVDMLATGHASEISLTVPEGYTVSDIDALLVKKGLIEAGAFSECARTCDLSGYAFLPQGAALAPRGGRVEGYLFPDTYFVFVDGFTAESFMKRLLDTFRKRVVDGVKEELASSQRSVHEIVTMASLIEEETRTNDERPVVSGILWKRFDQKMGLGVDAAVRYILDKSSAAITQTDLDVQSPYNLRKFRGLPPGPIASPGIASIKAAISPTDSDYWYYLHDKSGVIRHAVTNDEHNLNKAKYLR